MNRAVALLAFAVLCATDAWAEVTIRSGEHATFTRLVFTTAAGVGWSVTEESRQATVTLSDETDRFDTSQVFARIPRTRLQNLRDAGRGRLRLDLNCDCDVNAFQLNSGAFVVDIRDPAARPLAPKARAQAPATPIQVQTGVALPWIGATKTSRSVVPPLGFAGLDITPADTSQQSQLPEEPTDLSTARTRLVEEVGRAASQGLLAPTAPAKTTLSQSGAHETPESSYAPKPVAEAPRTSPLNLRVQSSTDDALAEAMAQVFGKHTEDGCLSDSDLDVSSWTSGKRFQDEIGHLRTRLYGEFDRIDHAVAEDLVKFYIHLGFGAEALFVLELIEREQAADPVLREMAEIVEHGVARDLVALKDQHACTTAAALWSVLAADPLDPHADIDQDAVLRSFDALPVHLRRYLGPIVSARLRDAGHLSIAQDTMRIVTRGSRRSDTATDMELSQLALESGDTDKAEDALQGVIAQNAPPSPEALIDLVDLRIAKGDPIDAETATLAAAYAFEFQDSALGVSLQRAHVLALMDSGQFEAAVTALADLEGELVPEKQKATRSAVFEGITEQASDAVFLKLVIPYFSASASRVHAVSENVVAGRLLALGVTSPTDTLLSEGASGPTGRDRRILRSRLAMLEARPRNAIAHLLGLEGKDVDLLRAQAFESLEEYARAGALYAGHDQVSDAQDMAVLARDWTYLESQTDRSWVLAEAPRQEDVATEPRIASIRSSLAALSESEVTQEQVDALLNAFQVDAALDETSQ